MERVNHDANDETPREQDKDVGEPATGPAPPSAVGDVEDAVSEEAAGSLTHWAPSEQGRTEGTDERESDEREGGM